MARKRRGRGEGGVYRRADGQWVGSISLGYADSGKRKRKAVYGATKKEVMDKLDRFRAEARVGSLPGAGELTVGQLLDRWLESSKASTETRTFEERQRLVKNHLRPRLGGLKLAKVNALHVESFYADMARDGVGATTVRHVANVLGVAFSHACKLKLLPFNPAAAIQKPKAPKRQMSSSRRSRPRCCSTPRGASPVTRCSSSRWRPGAGRASCWRSPGTTSTSRRARCRCDVAWHRPTPGSSSRNPRRPRAGGRSHFPTSPYPC